MAIEILGLIGGVAPDSTVDYYRRIVAGYRAAHEGRYPRVVINCVNLERVLQLAPNDKPGLAAWMIEEIERLKRAGAGLALITSNTPHVVIDQIMAKASLPMISIIDTACAHAQALGMKRVGLIGTRFTMEGGVYHRVFAKAGITVVIPDEPERTYVHDTYVNEIAVGDFRDATRERFVAIAEQMRDREQLQGLVLGGTELPLLLRGADVAGCPFIDTTALHVEAAIARMA